MRRRYRRRGQYTEYLILTVLVLLIMLALILFMNKWKADKKTESETLLPMQTESADPEERDRTVYVTFPSETFILEGEEMSVPAVHLLITAKPSRIVSIREAYAAYVMSLNALCDVKESLDGGVCDVKAALDLLASTNELLKEKTEAAFEDCLFMGKEDALDEWRGAVLKAITEIDRLCGETEKSAIELSEGINEAIWGITGE